jgi:hypothetical protein
LINIADRGYFIISRDNPSAGLVISGPLRSRTLNTWAITISRRINHPDGSFAGIVNAILKLSNFNQFYSSIDMGPHGVVTMRSDRMALIARHPKLEQEMGRPIPDYPAVTFIQQGKEQDVYTSDNTSDKVKRVYSFRRVGKFPLKDRVSS